MREGVVPDKKRKVDVSSSNARSEARAEQSYGGAAASSSAPPPQQQRRSLHERHPPVDKHRPSPSAGYQPRSSPAPRPMFVSDIDREREQQQYRGQQPPPVQHQVPRSAERTRQERPVRQVSGADGTAGSGTAGSISGKSVNPVIAASQKSNDSVSRIQSGGPSKDSSKESSKVSSKEEEHSEPPAGVGRVKSIQERFGGSSRVSSGPQHFAPPGRVSGSGVGESYLNNMASSRDVSES